MSESNGNFIQCESPWTETSFPKVSNLRRTALTRWKGMTLTLAWNEITIYKFSLQNGSFCENRQYNIVPFVGIVIVLCVYDSETIDQHRTIDHISATVPLVSDLVILFSVTLSLVFILGICLQYNLDASSCGCHVSQNMRHLVWERIMIVGHYPSQIIIATTSAHSELVNNAIP